VKLNQLIAIVAGKKNDAVQAVKVARDIFGQPSLFEGHAKGYTPYDDEGERLPEDSKKIQAGWELVLSEMFNTLGDASSIVAGIDHANTEAVCGIEVDGFTISEGVPATHLIYLEKQLQEIKKVVASIPTLDSSVAWSKDENQGWYVSEPVRSIRTQKVPTPFVRAEATVQHPAQVDLIGVDKGVGDWNSVRKSAAMPLTEKKAIVARVDKLITAVVQAREEANMQAASPREVLSVLLDYIQPTK